MESATNAASADLTRLAADLAAAANGGMDDAAHEVILMGAVRVQTEAQLRAPVKTGALKASITVTPTGPLSARIGPHVEYGAAQEFGTGARGDFPGTPYPINAKPGGTLSFTVGRQRVFTKRVMHPGVRAKRYMRQGLLAALGPSLSKALADAGALLITKGPNQK